MPSNNTASHYQPTGLLETAWKNWYWSRTPQLPNVVRIGNVINTDAEAILNKWKRDYANRFSEHSNSFDNNHLIFVKNRLHEIEDISSMVNHVIDEPNLTDLNYLITMKEIENVTKMSKNEIG